MSAAVVAPLLNQERTAAEIAARVTPKNYGYAPGDVRRYGADPSGIADSSAAFTTAGSIAGTVYVLAGAYLINDNASVGAATAFFPGAVVRPARGKTLTLSSTITADAYQIFDLSLGGWVQLPVASGDVWAEWWGAKGDGVKTDNEVPINQAIAALARTPGFTYGGTVHLQRGYFFISDAIKLSDQISLRGHGSFFTLIKANAATFSAATPQMILAKFGTAPMFNSRVEELRLDAAEHGTITSVIYAPAWQEKCGTDNVYIANFKTNGIRFDTGYGGASQWKIRRTEVVSAADPSAGGCIVIDAPGTVGWLSLELEEVQCASAPAPVTFATGLSAGATSGTLAANWPFTSGTWNVLFSDGESRAVTLTKGARTATWGTGLARNVTSQAQAVSPNAQGIVAQGRVILNVDDVHFEGLNQGFTLATAATIVGQSIQTDGNATVTTLFECRAGWTGTINATAVMRGGAANFIVDHSRPGTYPLANAPGSGASYPGGFGGSDHSVRVIWPPDPAIPFAVASVAGGLKPSISFGYGISGVQHAGTGNYLFTLSPAAFSINAYDVLASSSEPQTSVIRSSASQFHVLTFSGSGVATDASTLSVSVRHQR